MDMKSCSSCKADNPTDANFCRKCGEMFDDANFGGVTEKLLQKYHEIKRMCSIHEEREEDVKIRKCKDEMEESELRCEIEKLKEDLADKDHRIIKLKDELHKTDKECKALTQELHSIEKERDHEIMKYREEITCLSQELQVARHELHRTLHVPRIQDNEFKSFLCQLSEYKKFDILNVEVKNSGGDTGNEIISQDTTYLSLQLTIAVYENQTVTFQVKFFDSNGKLSVGDNSPSGFSYECTKDLHKLHVEKVSLVGWGSDKKGYWSSGNYSTEIWANGCLIYTKSFTIK